MFERHPIDPIIKGPKGEYISFCKPGVTASDEQQALCNRVLELLNREEVKLTKDLRNQMQHDYETLPTINHAEIKKLAEKYNLTIEELFDSLHL